MSQGLRGVYVLEKSSTLGFKIFENSNKLSSETTHVMHLIVLLRVRSRRLELEQINEKQDCA